jgi:preprotein translocase subunit SecF
MTASGKTSRKSQTAVVHQYQRSVNQTLSRTILTSGTTLIVLLSLYILGGGVIADFAWPCWSA